MANASLGFPDLAVSHLGDVLEDAKRKSHITAVTDLPLLVDIDMDWGSVLNIERALWR